MNEFVRISIKGTLLSIEKPMTMSMILCACLSIHVTAGKWDVGKHGSCGAIEVLVVKLNMSMPFKVLFKSDE
jgi:hypothetical protein